MSIPTTTDPGSLLQRFRTIRSETVELCRPLAIEDYVVQPIEDVSPPKWHLAHTTWFFETFLLLPHHKGYAAFHPLYAYLFNSYYESLGDRTPRPRRGTLSRPTVDEIYRYRDHVDRQVAEWMGGASSLPQDSADLFELGLHHEQQHQELLLTDIKYILGHNPLLPAYASVSETLRSAALVSHTFTEIDGGIYEIGHSGNGFCFDNEQGVHSVYLHPFRVQNRLVTNEEYLEFIDAGAYARPELWLSDGWDWIVRKKINAPLYWHRNGAEWHYYTLSGLKKWDRNAPVAHVSYYEADAYARWRGKRLPTEFEWEVACKRLSSTSPGSTGSTPNPQFYGNVWEWTGSAYRPYPFFRPRFGAVGEYNGKFMSGQMVLRGGSCATPRDHIRATYRNFFQPEKQWQFTGIRLAEDVR